MLAPKAPPLQPTIYIFLSGRFSSVPETEDLGVFPPAFPLTGPLFENRSVSLPKDQPQEMAIYLPLSGL